MVKKKKIVSPEKLNSLNLNCKQPNSESTSSQQTSEQQSHVATTKAVHPFKCRQFVSNRPNSSKKTKVWKNLKQIVSSDKSSAVSGVSYVSLDCPPSKKPTKKYSDLSGLPAKYRDPTTQLLYHNSDEFALIKTFSNDIINGYLELRKANV